MRIMRCDPEQLLSGPCSESVLSLGNISQLKHFSKQPMINWRRQSNLNRSLYRDYEVFLFFYTNIVLLLALIDFFFFNTLGQQK